jgi:hypothetical protein
MAVIGSYEMFTDEYFEKVNKTLKISLKIK